ncbi:MAG: hypothetical protein AAF902_19370 [Chloroflexota bacterium]
MSRFVFNPLFLLFLFISLFVYAIADAQQEPIQCYGSIEKIDLGSTGSCAMVLKDGGIQFSAVHPNGCVPRLSSVKAKNQLIIIHIDGTIPVDVGCLTVLSPYSVSTEKLDLANGEWQVQVIMMDNFGSTHYAGSVAIHNVNLYLPIIAGQA